MIKEDYVSYETAKLLKEKGFDWCESPFYSEQDRDEWRQNNSYTVPNEEYDPDLPFDSETLTLVAPNVSIQMAMKWLREREWFICIIPLAFYCGEKAAKFGYNIWAGDNLEVDEFSTPVFNTYEDACNAAIKYCLENLI